MASLIEDYAMIGDCRTAALIGKDGSLDWLCLPRFDSASCFTALLGDDDNGRWRIAPRDEVKKVSRSYVDGSLILRTRFETETGTIEVVDFMPVGMDNSHVVRLVKGVSGTVPMQLDLVVRFDYGVSVPWVSQIDDHTLSIVAGDDMLVLRTPVNLTGEDMRTVAEFIVLEGETAPFVLSYGASHLPPPSPIDIDTVSHRTKAFWAGWSGRCADVGRWTELVKRSLVTLKGLTYEPTGGIVAALTTSLPEQVGGPRNWDYRYCWLRDATFTLLAFLNAGYEEEAHLWRDWLLRAVAGSPAQIQIMYGVGGERRLDEWVVPWLKGYENSRPVRVGNAAAGQLQLDIYGELADALSTAGRGGLPPVPRGSELRKVLLEHLEEIWEQPDEGIWEIRGPAQNFVHSKVMAWVAFDRAAKSEHLGADEVKREHYRAIADRIQASVCEHGIDPERQCFTQAYGVDHMDASLLLLAIVGFLPADDPRIRNTVAEIEKRLLVNGIVLRYETDSGIDGLPPGEGAFLACSFWLVDNYVLQGRLEEAEALFERLAGLVNDVGLFAEEYDPAEKRHLGNFPQAFSHVALVNSAFALHRVGQRRDPIEGLPGHVSRHT
jgi:GH15 family glucan-1,4-alpha-glucosidase